MCWLWLSGWENSISPRTAGCTGMSQQVFLKNTVLSPDQGSTKIKILATVVLQATCTSVFLAWSHFELGQSSFTSGTCHGESQSGLPFGQVFAEIWLPDGKTYSTSPGLSHMTFLRPCRFSWVQTVVISKKKYYLLTVLYTVQPAGSGVHQTFLFSSVIPCNIIGLVVLYYVW